MEHNIEHTKTILLCDDVVGAILVRLPVKSLIRFTCVSKSWNSIIRDPMFIAAHSEAYNKEDCSCRRRYLLHMPDDPDRVSQFLTSTSAANRRLKPPFTQQQQMVAGSCQGLVCLYTGPREVVLWNPLLQIFKILPPPPPPPSSCSFNKDSCLIFGLGYSCKDNDHKVVRILYTNTNKDNPVNKVDIYSMKSNSWKSIECPAPLLPFHETGVAVNGRINWMAFPSPRIGPCSFTVIWFDIDKESFGQAVQSWDAYGSEWLQSPFVKEVLRLQEHEEYRRLSSNLWKMKTLASENSWLQLCPVRGEQRVLRVALFDGEMMLPTYSNNDLISFLGISVDGMPWEEENDSAPSWRTFHIVCVSESLRLLDHKM